MSITSTDSPTYSPTELFSTQILLSRLAQLADAAARQKWSAERVGTAILTGLELRMIDAAVSVEGFEAYINEMWEIATALDVDVQVVEWAIREGAARLELLGPEGRALPPQGMQILAVDPTSSDSDRPVPAASEPERMVSMGQFAIDDLPIVDQRTDEEQVMLDYTHLATGVPFRFALKWDDETGNWSLSYVSAPNPGPLGPIQVNI